MHANEGHVAIVRSKISNVVSALCLNLT